LRRNHGAVFLSFLSKRILLNHRKFGWTRLQNTVFNRKTYPMAGDETPVWYFAYGSNMSSDKFSNRRGIHPLASARILVPGWRLTFEVPGMPYSEPGMSSIAPIDRVPHVPTARDPEKSPEAGVVVQGRAYLITPLQLVQVVKSEGGGIAYKMEKLHGEAVGPEDEAQLGGRCVDVFALVNVPAMSRENPEPLPSKRYKGLLLDGAREAVMPEAYMEFLRTLPQYDATWRDEDGTARTGCERGRDYKACSGYSDLEKGAVYGTTALDDGVCDMSMSRSKPGAKLGALIFLAIFTPLLSSMEKLCYMFIRPTDGECPRWVKVVVRWVVWWIWFCHDVGFAPIFGPGDGRDQRCEPPAATGERSPLLASRNCEQMETAVHERAEETLVW